MQKIGHLADNKAVVEEPIDVNFVEAAVVECIDVDIVEVVAVG